MKKQKSLRQLARELGVSHSYLSQVKHGKCRASQEVVSKMVSSGLLKGDDLGYNPIYAEVAQAVEQRTENPRVGGSNPPLGTSTDGALADILTLQLLTSSRASFSSPSQETDRQIVC